jgi:hypothetical protein
MLAVLLLLTSAFATEVSNSLGKKSVFERRENVYDLVFLSLFWGLIFLLATLGFGAVWHFDPASLPFFIPRVLLEIGLAYISAEAIILADRTTVGFLRLLTIPLLLVVDLSLGYHITQLQVFGIALMFIALVMAFHHNPAGRRGAWIAALSGVLATAAVSLFKYDITHFNSVVAEQSLSIGAILIFFGLMSYRQRHKSPFRLLFRPVTGTQSLANGVAVVLESFAMSLVPASVMITLKRSFALMWAIIFGGAYFHEHSIKRKASSGILMVVSIVLIASPQLFRG